MEEKPLETQCEGCKDWCWGLSTAEAEPRNSMGICPSARGLGFSPSVSLRIFMEHPLCATYFTRNWRDHQESKTLDLPPRSM